MAPIQSARVSHGWRLGALAIALSATTTAMASQANDLRYTFDSGLDGFGVSGASVSAGGGHLSLQDIDDSDFAVSLPAADLGDWSRFTGGTFSFDAVNLNGARTDWSTFGTLRIESGSLVVERDIVSALAPSTTWATYSATLDAATWGAVLGRVTRATLTLESHIGWDAASGYELNGLDNVQVTAVPEPDAAWLALAGLLSVGAWVRRRASRA